MNTPSAVTPPISADLVTAAQVGLAQPTLDGGLAYWLEVRPEEGGRTVLVRRPLDGEAADLTPAPFNVRTRVHEYGGGAYAALAWYVAGVLYFALVGRHHLVLSPEEEFALRARP